MVIDELVAVLGFDLKNTDDLRRFNQGLDGAAKRAENFSRNMGKLALKAAGVATAMAAAGAAAAKGLVSFVTPVTQKMDELVKASDRLGIGFENLQALGFAAEQSGSSIEGLQASLQSVTRNLSEASRGTGRAKIVLEDYGLSAVDAAGKIKNADTFLLELADRFEGLSEQQQVDLAGKLGIDNGLITLLKSGRRGIKELTDQARALGFVIDEKAARGAEKFNDQMNVLSNIWFGIRNRAALGMVPWMTKFAEDLEAWYRNNAEAISELVESIVSGIGAFAARVKGHFTTLSNLYDQNRDALQRWFMPFKVLLAAFLIAKFPMTAAIVALLAVIEDLLAYLGGHNSVLGEFIEYMAWFTGTEPQQVAAALASFAEATAWMAVAAVGVGAFAGAISKLASALGKLRPVIDVMARLAGFKQWGAVAAGAAAVAATTAPASAAGAIGAGAAGVAGNAASKAPWLPGMRSPLGRLLGPVIGTGFTALDFKERMDRLAVITEENGGDQVKALEELQRENSLSVYEAADKMTKVLEAIKENTQGLLNWMGFGGGGGGKSAIADAIRASGYQGSGGKSAIADSIRGGSFDAKAPSIMNRLMRDFGLTREQAAGIVGNLGHETGGFRHMQELNPTVRGSRGGFGWAQWTGPRRRQFEAWAKARGLDPRSDEANYGFLAHELKTTESGALNAVRRQSTVGGATRVFEQKFERAGVKHYGSRQAYAERAYRSASGGGSEMAQNYQGNIARIDGATAAANATMISDKRAVTQNITVGDVHAAPGERVDRATARAVGSAAAGAGRTQQVARIAAEPAALP